MSETNTPNLVTLKASTAVSQLQTILEQEKIVLLALGKGQGEEEFVQRAQMMVGGVDDPAVVVWAKEPISVQEVLRSLSNDQNLNLQGRAALACSISLPRGLDERRHIVDVIQQHEAPTFTRILSCITKAFLP